MIQVDVQGDLSAAMARARLMQKEMAGATTRALNRTITTVRAQAVRDVAPSYPAIKAGDLRARMQLVNASRTTLAGRIVFSGRRMAMYGKFGMKVQGRFGVRFTKLPWRIEDIDGSAIPAEMLARTFRNRLRRSGRAAVFARWGARRLPIGMLMAPGVAKAVTVQGIDRRLAVLARRRFHDVLDQEVRFLLTQRAA